MNGPDTESGLDVWFAGPEAAEHFDAAALSPADAERWKGMENAARRADRRAHWTVSRALLAHCRIPADARSSLSHSAGFAALAVERSTRGRMKLGIDIEQSRPREVEALAEFSFAATEHADLLDLPPDARRRHFYLLWTLKEAAAKALDLNLLTATQSCVFRCIRGRWQGALPTSHGWRAWAVSPREDLMLGIVAVATSSHPLPESLICHEWPVHATTGWEEHLILGG